MATEQFIYINAIGDKFYYKDKAMTIRHREDGPAAEWFNGDKAWLVDGSIHRTDGPARIWYNGTKEWWVEGVQLTEDEFNKKYGSTYSVVSLGNDGNVARLSFNDLKSAIRYSNTVLMNMTDYKFVSIVHKGNTVWSSYS